MLIIKTNLVPVSDLALYKCKYVKISDMSDFLNPCPTPGTDNYYYPHFTDEQS